MGASAAGTEGEVEEAQRLDVAGVGVAYRDTGGVAAPTVLMTHGFGASSHMFAANAQALAADHRVITWDLRGHGASDAPEDRAAYSIATSINDMRALLDRVGAERAVLVGHSLGGYLSLAFNLVHPERVAALVLVGTGPGYRKPQARDGWNTMAIRFAETFEQRGLGAHEGGEEFDASVHVNGAVGLARAARGILTQHDSSVIDSLPEIRVPALVVVGERDEPFRGGSDYMAGKIPDASLVVVPGAGHAPNVTHPAVFDRALREFLGRVPLEGGG